MAGRPPRPEPHFYNHLQNPRVSLSQDAVLVIKLPDLRFLLVLSRSLFLATVIITLPCIRSVLEGYSASAAVDFRRSSGSISSEYWNLLWRDFANEGLVKKGQNALVLNSDIEGVYADDDEEEGSMFMNTDGINVVFEPDFGSQSSLPNEGFDFVFVSGSIDSQLVDQLVKVGGIVAMQLSDEISTGYQKQSDYRIVYLKKYRSTIVALKKLGPKNHIFDSSAKRKLCDMTMESKKAALRGLEDALYEPPRKKGVYSKKIKFLPDLLGDSLEHYPRRVFINVGSGDNDEDKHIVTKWFEKNYPKRNQVFEVYGSETVSDRIDVSDWLTNNVGKEDYVVMKAEAGVVEKMIERKVLGLVDELFFECNNQWQDQVKTKKKNRKLQKRKPSQRAYWECLALYGMLLDEGVAVHQWWD